ncbi:uncharacterized protein HMPREF1541_04058 [Cyphellophora europaea CBS 101466]|uniref:Ribosome biogenesis protein Urb1 n=1 Tax=Cyphellophora europaea (strain CBS 101466) TaxID=1220924 RepID=W2S242_CYPE1|nr:uncharacterized protein HMPREF1541_04058 [Cyphellophora europaea CBS 101466]ETN42118.1 hypothetical protein HMPREF1541_04058 [Cyphellophora europaea CBS 101466]
MAGDGPRDRKRRRLDNDPQHPDGDIRGAFELHNLLRFRQSAEPEVKAGIDRFRSFLIEISSKEPTEKTILLKVLKQYCDDQSSSSNEEVDFRDLLSTWSFAAQNNIDAITSAVPAALAQFFRTISNDLEFREFGLSLCHSLLKSDQLHLLDRGLSAPKHKDFVISPCLRLLTEMISFDAGALAADVFSRRDVLFKRLDTLLDASTRRQDEADRRRPTVRRNAQRLLLAMLRYLDAEAKTELITQGKALYSCIRSLIFDGGDIVRDILKTVRLSLLGSELQKATKTRFLNAGNLQLFAQLYDFEAEEVDETTDVVSVRQAAHDFLIHACTSDTGAVVAQNGWYPANYELHGSFDDDDSGIDLGLDSPYYADDYTTSVPVKNTNLSLFLQKLKPASDVLQAELVTKIFAAAPELVADYFCKRPKSLGAPSDDDSWLGEFGFLFSVVDLPAPPHLGFGVRSAISPPPLSIAAENILPRSLDRTTTTAFLKKTEDMTTMSACRLLTVALRKLGTVIKMFRSVSGPRHLWIQAITKLSSIITARAPLYNEIVAALQKTPKDNQAVRGAVLECMAAYKKVLPAATAASSFDITPALLGVLQQLHRIGNDSPAQDGLETQKVALVTIAGLSRGTKWWHKPSTEHLSPIMALLIDATGDRSHASAEPIIRSTLEAIFVEKGILCPGKLAWIALEQSLRSTSSTLENYDGTLMLFLENCMIRTMKQPVKYVEYLEDVQKEVSDSTRLSLVACAVAEQWPHALQNDDLTTTIHFTSILFALLAASDENAAVLEVLRSRMLSAAESHKRHRKTLKKAFEAQARDPATHQLPSPAPSRSSSAGPEKELSTADNITSVFPEPIPLPTSHRPLPPTYTPDSDLSANPSTSRLATQIRSLSSPTSEVRLGALSTLTNLVPSLLTSSYSEATQLHLLLGELLETARQHAIETASTSTSEQQQHQQPLPAIVTELAVMALSVITDPSDAMYGKVNRWLMRGPNWQPLTRVVPYWVSRVLLEEPESEAPGAGEAEMLRLLAVLADGMRARQDAELCRRAGVWERLGSVCLRAGCKREVRRGVLRCFWAVAGVEEGANTLITRVGVRAWLDVLEGRERGEMREVVRKVRERVEEACDAEYIRRWEQGVGKKGTVLEAVDAGVGARGL